MLRWIGIRTVLSLSRGKKRIPQQGTSKPKKHTLSAQTKPLISITTVWHTYCGALMLNSNMEDFPMMKRTLHVVLPALLAFAPLMALAQQLGQVGDGGNTRREFLESHRSLPVPPKPPLKEGCSDELLQQVLSEVGPNKELTNRIAFGGKTITLRCKTDMDKDGVQTTAALVNAVSEEITEMLPDIRTDNLGCGSAPKDNLARLNSLTVQDCSVNDPVMPVEWYIEGGGLDLRVCARQGADGDYLDTYTSRDTYSAWVNDTMSELGRTICSPHWWNASDLDELRSRPRYQR